MSERPVLLKVLLRQRHWQHYGTFRAEYDKAARLVDPNLVGTWPSRAQLHRWLSGSLKGLPYPDHCRVLEQLFPNYSAQVLFGPCPDELLRPSDPRQKGSGPALNPQLAGDADQDASMVPAVAARVYVERAFTHEHVRIDFAGFPERRCTTPSRSRSTRSEPGSSFRPASDSGCSVNPLEP